MSPLLFDVYGRRVAVERTGDQWTAYEPAHEGKRRQAVGLPIPGDLAARDLARYLGDLLHEDARPDRSGVHRLRSAGTVIFDFDSTLITAESLEVLVAASLARDPALQAGFEAITRGGMEGRIGFEESLSARLALAKPTRADIQAFAEQLDTLWTPGMPDLVAELRWRGVDVWVTSGALMDCLVPAASRLGIPMDQVRGVRTIWDEHGTLMGPDPDDLFSRSKVEGIRHARPNWESPAVMVGDGATDRAVVDAGLADWFVAYTGNVAREAVTRGVPHVASGVRELRETLATLLP